MFSRRSVYFAEFGQSNRSIANLRAKYRGKRWGFPAHSFGPLDTHRSNWQELMKEVRRWLE